MLSEAARPDLTAGQLLALLDLNDAPKPRAVYQMALKAEVLRRLARRGLVQCHGGSGQHSVWSITDAGRAALSGSPQ